MHMSTGYLHSVILELAAKHPATLPVTVGQQTHALFLNLISQVDPCLATRLHEEPGYRPFTVSFLSGGHRHGDHLALQSGERCFLRVTLLDGGPLWSCLRTRFTEGARAPLSLGAAQLELDRLISTPAADPTGWAAFTDWRALALTPARSSITLRFASPTAFSLGQRQFSLSPDPTLVWRSLLRTWNLYAPEEYRLAKEPLRDFISSAVFVERSTVSLATVHYATHPQRGFVGECRYLIRRSEQEAARHVAMLAEFSRYAGIGSKTTMGMGQVRAVNEDAQKQDAGREMARPPAHGRVLARRQGVAGRRA